MTSMTHLAVSVWRSAGRDLGDPVRCFTDRDLSDPVDCFSMQIGCLIERNVI